MDSAIPAVLGLWGRWPGPKVATVPTQRAYFFFFRVPPFDPCNLELSLNFRGKRGLGFLSLSFQGGRDVRHISLERKLAMPRGSEGYGGKNWYLRDLGRSFLRNLSCLGPKR